jgi:hypothetical protein
MERGMKDELKDIGRLRKAMMPLFKLLPEQFFEENERRFALLEKKLDKLTIPQPEIVVKAPIVNVPAAKIDIAPPEVTVNLDPDSITQALIKAKNLTSPSPYEPHDQAKGQIFKYSGFLRDDGSWYIQRIAKGEQRYAKGQGGYADAWDGRSKLRYGHIDR